MMETPETTDSDAAASSSEQAVAPPNDSTSVSHAASVLDQVRERGFITTGEIFAAFPDLEPDADELRDLWEMFETRGIKVLDEIAEELKLEDERRGAQSAPRERAPAPPRRVEHRPSAAPRPGGGSRRAPFEEPDPELAAVRAAARPTHSESGSFDP